MGAEKPHDIVVIVQRHQEYAKHDIVVNIEFVSYTSCDRTFLVRTPN